MKRYMILLGLIFLVIGCGGEVVEVSEVSAGLPTSTMLPTSTPISEAYPLQSESAEIATAPAIRKPIETDVTVFSPTIPPPTATPTLNPTQESELRLASEACDAQIRTTFFDVLQNDESIREVNIGKHITIDPHWAAYGGNWEIYVGEQLLGEGGYDIDTTWYDINELKRVEFDAQKQGHHTPQKYEVILDVPLNFNYSGYGEKYYAYFSLEDGECIGHWNYGEAYQTIYLDMESESLTPAPTATPDPELVKFGECGERVAQFFTEFADAIRRDDREVVKSMMDFPFVEVKLNGKWQTIDEPEFDQYYEVLITENILGSLDTLDLLYFLEWQSLDERTVLGQTAGVVAVRGTNCKDELFALSDSFDINEFTLAVSKFFPDETVKKVTPTPRPKLLDDTLMGEWRMVDFSEVNNVRSGAETGPYEAEEMLTYNGTELRFIDDICLINSRNTIDVFSFLWINSKGIRPARIQGDADKFAPDLYYGDHLVLSCEDNHFFELLQVSDDRMIMANSLYFMLWEKSGQVSQKQMDEPTQIYTPTKARVNAQFPTRTPTPEGYVEDLKQTAEECYAQQRSHFFSVKRDGKIVESVSKGDQIMVYPEWAAFGGDWSISVNGEPLGKGEWDLESVWNDTIHLKKLKYGSTGGTYYSSQKYEVITGEELYFSYGGYGEKAQYFFDEDSGECSFFYTWGGVSQRVTIPVLDNESSSKYENMAEKSYGKCGEELEAFFASFAEAIAVRDVERVMSFVSFPVETFLDGKWVVVDEAGFQENYDRIVTEGVRETADNFTLDNIHMGGWRPASVDNGKILLSGVWCFNEGYRQALESGEETFGVGIVGLHAPSPKDNPITPTPPPLLQNDTLEGIWKPIEFVDFGKANAFSTEIPTNYQEDIIVKNGVIQYFDETCTVESRYKIQSYWFFKYNLITNAFAQTLVEQYYADLVETTCSNQISRGEIMQLSDSKIMIGNPPKFVLFEK